MKLTKHIKINIRKEMIPYIITWIFYYAWVIVFTTWWTSSPTTDELIKTDARVLLHSINLISSALFVCIIKKSWFKKTSIIGGISLVFFFFLSLLKLSPILHLIIIIMLGVSIGAVNIGILIPMVYVLNNNEKILAIISSNLLISVLVLFQETRLITSTTGQILSIIILLLSLIPIKLFNKSDIVEENNENKLIKEKLNKVMYLSIILNCVYAILCKGMGKAFVVVVVEKATLNLYPIYYIGGISGCIIFYIIYKLNKASNYVSWNIIFGLFATAMFIYSTKTNDMLNYVFSFIMGMVSTMGMINMYYSIGAIGKKYNNHKYLKLSILLIGLLGGVSGSLLGSIISNINTMKISMTLSLVIVIIIVVFLVISPALSNKYNEEDATKDGNKIISSNLNKYKLTNKEQELCSKLIEGFTLKQASAMMGIKYNTANGYYKNIYKKLDVNSKIELLNKIKTKN